MSFTNPAPFGGYVLGDKIDEEEINYWCGALPDAIDGAQGGTYNLANPLVITGDNVEIESLIADDLRVNGTLLGNLTTAADVTVGDDLTVTDDMTVNGDARVKGLTFVEESLDVTYGVTCDSLTAVTGNFVGSLSWIFKTSAAPNSNASFFGSDAGKVVFIETITGSRVYTLSGLYDAGQWFLFMHRAAGGYTATVNGVALTVGQSAFFVNNGSTWRHFKVEE